MRTDSSWKRCGRPRCGFSLVELAVVLVIISIVTALSLVGVQALRESARRMKCTTRLRELTLAVSQYESANGHFPPAGNDPLRETATDEPVDLSSGYWRIFGFLGYGALGETVKDINPRTLLLVREDRSRLLRFAPYRATVPALLCPSDSSLEGTNYRRCSGSKPWAAFISNEGRPCVPDGAFGGLTREANEILDGLSHTAAFSERRIARGDRVDGRANTWWTPLRPDFHRYDDRFFRGVAEGLAGRPRHEFSWVSGLSWHHRGKNFTLYDHIFPPNAPYSGIGKGIDHYLNVWSGKNVTVGAVGASSFHRGGVNVSRLDGSVAFFTDSIDDAVWNDLATINDAAPQTP